VFDTLPPAEKDLVTSEILRRWAPDGGVSDATLDELAAVLFRNYEAEEAVPHPDCGVR
jgi:hypothetical protein